MIIIEGMIIINTHAQREGERERERERKREREKIRTSATRQHGILMNHKCVQKAEEEVRLPPYLGSSARGY